MWTKFDMAEILPHGLPFVQRRDFADQPGAVRVALGLRFMPALGNTKRGPDPS
jgi:hypothetical protein